MRGQRFTKIKLKKKKRDTDKEIGGWELSGGFLFVRVRVRVKGGKGI